jgi:hypothetical protein
MDALVHQLAERGIDGALALDPGEAGEGGAFDGKGKMAFTRGIVAAVTAMLFAVIGEFEVGRVQRCRQAAGHFGGDRAGGGRAHCVYIEAMQAMRITIIRGAADDRIDVVRADGSAVATRLPHKGPIPHDVVHLAVEGELGIERGFWGLVAAGRHPEEIAALAKAAGHASAKRRQEPASDFVPAIQAERLVEAFEADHWSGGKGDPAGVRAMATAGCAHSLVPAPPLDDREIARIRARLAAFAETWSGIAQGQSLTLDWPVGA